MLVYVIIAAAASVLGLAFLIGYNRRQHSHPAVYQISMARHLWQPDRRK